ncbi:MAG TPA: adenylosuccinate synthase [Exilispira sp.]|nr:adenylosuccinate synthase [Exilispira sp.]
MSFEKGYVDAIVGLQWGDEGKAKIVDLLSSNYDYTIRVQGGANAGHTVVHKEKKFIFHIIPSSVLNDKSISIIGNGVVFDPKIFVEELSSLKSFDKNIEKRIVISDKATLVLPIHKKIDEIRDEILKIGTTKRGIGPAYESKVARVAIKLFDLVTDDWLKKLKLLIQYYGYDPDGEEFNENKKFILKYKPKILPFIDDTERMVVKALNENKKILCEGAQGAALDIDFGTYPYVTSSNTIISSIFSGGGIPLRSLRYIFGLFKIYCTRVGNGPFPTELNDELANKIRDEGREYGSTTGRPRRIGWLDLPMLKYYARLTGTSHLILTKADIFCNLEYFKVCVAYQNNTTLEVIEEYPPASIHLHTPIYKEFKGFSSLDSKEFNEFIKFIEEYLNLPIYMVSTGPEKEKYTILKPEIYNN